LENDAISGCLYLDSCVLLSEILEQNKSRMSKFKNDVKQYNITCYVSQGVIDECKEKLEKTTDFLGNILRDTIVVYLEGIRTNPRDLSCTEPSNEDLHIIEETFLTVNQAAREFDLVSDPFQAVEEWVVAELEREMRKSKKSSLSDLVLKLTAAIMKEINDLESDFERIVELEADYIIKSTQAPCAEIRDILVQNGIHRPDADHISVIESHRRNLSGKAIFLTFDYKSIILRAKMIRRLTNIDCCDPLYGVSYLR